jgi:hypothetical protein
VRLQQPQRLRDEVRAILPRRRAHSRDLAGTDGLSVVGVLGVSERAEHDALLGGRVSRS